MQQLPEEEVQLATSLRKGGMSFKQIARQMDRGVGTIHKAVRHVVVDESRRPALMRRGTHLLASKAMQERSQARREEYREAGRIAARKGDVRHAMACALYWAEGGKSRNTICLANTDCQMIKMFYSFLLQTFSKKPCFEFVYHGDEGNEPVEVARAFWSNLLGIPEDEIRSYRNADKRPRSNLKKNRYAYGMGVIKLHSTEAVQHIYGALEVYAGVVLCNE